MLPLDVVTVPRGARTGEPLTDATNTTLERQPANPFQIPTMTFVTPRSDRTSINDLHDLQPCDFNEIVIEVRRRAELGAGAYSGVQFLSNKEPIARFETVNDALAFIDNLHSGGVVHAIKQELVGNCETDQITYDHVVEELQFYNDSMEPKEYVQRTGIDDPMNLQIIPHRELVKPVAENEKPATDTNESIIITPPETPHERPRKQHPCN